MDMLGAIFRTASYRRALACPAPTHDERHTRFVLHRRSARLPTQSLALQLKGAARVRQHGRNDAANRDRSRDATLWLARAAACGGGTIAGPTFFDGTARIA